MILEYFDLNLSFIESLIKKFIKLFLQLSYITTET